MTCQTCNGAGYVRGHWMPELCPACSGMKEWNEPEPDPRMKHTHNIEKFQLWVAIGEILAAVLLVAFAGSLFYLVGLSV